MVNGISCAKNGQIVTTVGADSTLKHWKLYNADLSTVEKSNNINLKADQHEKPLFMTTTKAPVTCIHHQQTKVSRLSNYSMLVIELNYRFL